MIYLDNAATTYEKPPCVREAVNKWLNCGNPGRGSHRVSLAASELIYRAREEAGKLFGAETDRVVFTQNATAALNCAIKGTIRDGIVITSDFEHNSVRRPVMSLSDKGVCRKTFISERVTSVVRQLQKQVSVHTSAVVCVHSSNVTGRAMPIREIGELCRQRGVLFIVDASQSAGNTKIDMARDNIDILCAAGHKGLMGIQGSGLMVLGHNVDISPLIEGGSGSDSRSVGMPDYLPDRLEAGTLSTPAIAALLSGMRFVSQIGEENIGNHERAMWQRAYERLSELEGVRVYDNEFPGANLLFNLVNIEPSTVAAELDRRGICVRAGLHCAPDAHDALGSKGAVRASFGYFTRAHEIDIFAAAVKDIIRSGV